MDAKNIWHIAVGVLWMPLWLTTYLIGHTIGVAVRGFRDGYESGSNE